MSKHVKNELIPSDFKIAVLIPCYNEELSIGKVVDDFKEQLPSAKIYIFDNCSTDKTALIAAGHKAIVIREARQGKGFVVESMFDQINADVYVMVDGDDTYPANLVHELMAPILANNADMVVGARLANYKTDSFRPLHVLGNNLVRWLINLIFKANLADIMSGYRVFNRRVIERIPVISSGFEIETEMTIQMLHYKLKILEVQVPYQARMTGSQSKLNTVSDGFRVLWKIFSLFRAFKPLTFFGGTGLLLLALGLLAGILPIHDYFTDPEHRVLHVPLTILATGLIILSGSCMFLGILLHAVTQRFKELHNVLTRKKNS